MKIPEISDSRIAISHSDCILQQLEKIAPQLVIVFPDKIAASQLQIWEPYLLASDCRSCVCAKNSKNKSIVSKLPIFYQDSGFEIKHLKALKSIKAFLYVTNRPNNFNYLNKFPLIKHVFIGHGDSEKDASASRFSKVYDYLLVADTNAYVRYIANKVRIPKSSFLMMGAPTLPGLLVQKSIMPIKHILYAPTFEGKSDEKNYSSLAKIDNLLKEFLKEGRYSFCFRPHPGTGQRLKNYSIIKQSLKDFSTQNAPQAADKVQQFNWADVIVTDISGVLSEFLFTGKPIIVPVASKDNLTLSAVHGTSLHKYIYLWDYTQIDLNTILRTVADDPLFRQRHRYRDVKFRGAACFRDSADNFWDAMRLLLNPEKRTAQSAISRIKLFFNTGH